MKLDIHKDKRKDWGVIMEPFEWNGKTYYYPVPVVVKPEHYEEYNVIEKDFKNERTR